MEDNTNAMSPGTEEPLALITTALVVVSVVFPLISLICVVLRYKARRTAAAPLLADDWWMLISWVFAFFLSLDVWVVGSITGVNHYKIDIAEGLRDSVIALAVSGVVAQVALTTVKISVLFFYKRIFPTRSFRISVWVGVAVVSAWGITIFFLLIFQGNTVEGTFTGTAKWVVDTTQLGLAQAWTSILLDVAILFYPLPVIFKLHMRTSRKVAIALILWLGLFCSVAAAVRLALVKENIEKVSESAGLKIHSEYVEIIFVIIEPNLSIVAACLPCYGCLFQGTGRHLGSMLQSVRSVFSLKSFQSTSRITPGQTRQADERPIRGSDSILEMNDYDSFKEEHHHVHSHVAK